MADPIPAIPDRWTSEIGGPPRTLSEAEAAINGGGCIGTVVKRDHIYETVLQGIFNGLKVLFTGEGAERSTSTGTAIETRYHCFTDSPSQETRTVEVSRNMTIDAECRLHVTAVRQQQKQFSRNWVRWTVTVVSHDDPESAVVNTAVATLIGLLGLPVAGAAVAVFTVGTAVSFSQLYAALTRKTIYVSRNTAGPETIWKPDGTPTSHVLATVQLSPEICELIRHWFPWVSESDGAVVSPGSGTPAERE